MTITLGVKMNDLVKRLRRLFGAAPEPVPVCPYCAQLRTRQSCIDEWMAKHVLPACACGPRYDAPAQEKKRFRAWMDDGQGNGNG
jgi:hypothetical protein